MSLFYDKTNHCASYQSTESWMVMTTRMLRAKANDLTKCMNMLTLHNVVVVQNYSQTSTTDGRTTRPELRLRAWTMYPSFKWITAIWESKGSTEILVCTQSLHKFSPVWSAVSCRVVSSSSGHSSAVESQLSSRWQNCSPDSNCCDHNSDSQ